MKNKLLLLIILLIGFIVNSCGGDEEQELEKNQSVKLENLFNEGYSATITGYFKDSEWDGVAGKIESALNGAYTAGNFLVKLNFESVFDTGVVTIIVEKNPTGYTKWKTSADGKTMWLVYGALDIDLQGSVNAAVDKMFGPEEGFAQVMKQNRVRFVDGMEYTVPVIQILYYCYV